MFSLKTHALICGGLFAALLVVGWGGSILQGIGLLPKPEGGARIALMVLMFGLVAAFAFSAIPVMIKLVIGNARGSNMIVYAIWALMAAGLVVGAPAAIHFGLFDQQPKDSDPPSP